MKVIDKVKLYREKYLISKQANEKGQYDLYEFVPVYDKDGELISSVGRFRFFADMGTIDKKIDQWTEE